MKKRSIFCGILFFSFSIQASIRFAISSHTAQHFNCYQARQEAMNSCYQWMQNVTSTLHVVEMPYCDFVACICDGVGRVTCPGAARYDDGLADIGTPRVQFTSQSDSGFNCNDASFGARTALWEWASEFSMSHPITQFDLGRPCYCSGFQATCGGSVSYLDPL